MKPEETGRFCGSCQKTVVDFSLMSDREVLGYIAAVSGKVCGRFAEDQLKRELMPPPQRKSKAWVIWNILVAGLLVASKAKGQGKTPGVSQQVTPGKTADPGKTTNPGAIAISGKTPKPVLMGAPARVVMGKMAARPLPPVTGEVAFRPDDTVASIVVVDPRIASEKDTSTPAPHYQELTPAVVYGYRTTGSVDIVGAVSSISDDTLVNDLTKPVIQQFISDSLAFLGIGKKAFALYPNPAGRGTVIKLSLNLDKTGRYAIGLYNAAGVLLQNKAVDLAANSGVELFSLPVSLPGGLYFVKLSGPGLKTVYTQKLIVL